MSKILRLTSENIKRLKAVEITPKGDLVIIGGKNGAGKSSLLDSVEYLIGGTPQVTMPIRKGQTKGRIVGVLGEPGKPPELVVRRTFSAGGSALVVENADGVRQTKPQEILDRLKGLLTFDPLEFAWAKPEQQAEILRGLVGLDFTEHDEKAKALYDKRTAANRDAKALKARMEGMNHYDDAPAKEESVGDILIEQEDASQINQANQAARNSAAERRRSANDVQREAKKVEDLIAEQETAIAELQKKLAVSKCQLENTIALLEVRVREAEAAENAAGLLVDKDLAPFQERARNVEAQNAKVRANASRAAVVRDYKAKAAEADKLTRQLEELDAERAEKCGSAKYPIKGLEFDPLGGVTFNGIPFAQASTAEQLRVSVAIGIALNPTLKVLLIRDGSLLDSDSKALIRDMAAESKSQVWMEDVNADGKTAVIIEDGSVVEQPAQEEAKLT